MRVLLIKPLPEYLNPDFNRQYSVGQVFEAFVTKGEEFVFRIKTPKPGWKKYPITYEEADCFKKLP